ncbi:peptidylprolyl isomerase [Candidatus Liberibacter asiaticus]
MTSKVFTSLSDFIKLLTTYFVLIIFCIVPIVSYKSWAMSSRIRTTINGEVITDGDISKRIALLKLQKINGELEKIAVQELIVETLKKQEIEKSGITFDSNTVNYFFVQHARNTGLSAEDFSSFLDKQGIGDNHFKQYLAIQSIWPDVVKNDFMLKYGNLEMEIPANKQKMKNITVREYLIRTVLFSIPDNKLQNQGFVQNRIKDAEESRLRLPKDCNKLEKFASKIHDVSIGKAQYLLESDLHPQFQNLLKKSQNNTTNPYVTQKGVEYIAICDKRDLGGEIALKAYLSAQNTPTKIEKHEAEYVKKLRSNAIIHYY